MAWYIWTAERAGAYEIALVPEVPDDVTDGALLALRYFPDPGEQAFRDCSAVEQAVRRSALFDRTGTPAFGQAEALDPALFCIGALVLTPQGDERFTLRLHAPDRWIEDVRDADGGIGRRDVAAAELALPLVDALVGGIVYLGRAAPALVRIWRRAGTVLRVAPDDLQPPPADPAITDWEIEWSGLAMPGRAPGFEPASRVCDPPVRRGLRTPGRRRRRRHPGRSTRCGGRPRTGSSIRSACSAANAPRKRSPGTSTFTPITARTHTMTTPPDLSRRGFLLGRTPTAEAPAPNPWDQYFGSYEMACAQVNEARPFLADEARRLNIDTEGKSDLEILKAVFETSGSPQG